MTHNTIRIPRPFASHFFDDSDPFFDVEEMGQDHPFHPSHDDEQLTLPFADLSTIQPSSHARRIPQRVI